VGEYNLREHKFVDPTKNKKN